MIKMGKRIITQRRGKGSLTYRAHSHRYKGTITHRRYDEVEKTSAMNGKIIDLIHCPGHSAPMAVIRYDDGETVLTAAPIGVKIGDNVTSGSKAEIKVGCTLPLKNIPEGTSVYNLETSPGDGGKLCRTSGTTARILTKIGKKILIVLPSKKEKTFDSGCRATIGTVAGVGRTDKPWVKAGKKHHAMRTRGKLFPRTAGVAMNAVDHPFGCGRGRHIGKPKTAPRFAPPGRNVGLIRARRTGKRK